MIIEMFRTRWLFGLCFIHQIRMVAPAYPVHDRHIHLRRSEEILFETKSRRMVGAGDVLLDGKNNNSYEIRKKKEVKSTNKKFASLLPSFDELMH